MEIELTREQIEKIANVVRKDFRRPVRKEQPRHIIRVGVCLPGGGKIVADKEARFRAAGRDLWKHARRLVEGLLSHVDETIEEA